jgi:hypothetical protein
MLPQLVFATASFTLSRELRLPQFLQSSLRRSGTPSTSFNSAAITAVDDGVFFRNFGLSHITRGYQEQKGKFLW